MFCRVAVAILLHQEQNGDGRVHARIAIEADNLSAARVLVSDLSANVHSLSIHIICAAEAHR